MTTNRMITPTYDTIAIALATDLISIPAPDFLATHDAHDDAAHFAELNLIDTRDEPTMIADAHASTSPDCDYDSITDMILDIMRDRYDDLIDYTTAIITRRLTELRPF